MLNLDGLKFGSLYYYDSNAAVHEYDNAYEDTFSKRVFTMFAKTMFVPLEVSKYIEGGKLCRIKILTTEGKIGWLTFGQEALRVIRPMTSCDKDL